MSSEINDCVRRSLNRYFRDLDGQAPHAIYGMVMKCVERPMLEVVMKQAHGNQLRASEMLGAPLSTAFLANPLDNLENTAALMAMSQTLP